MGATIVQQGFRAGLLDELVISLVPVVLGRGARPLDSLEPGSIQFDLVRVSTPGRHPPDLPSHEVAQFRHARCQTSGVS
jgi:dihydrofolate reductase